MAWADMTLEQIRLEIRELLQEDESETDPLWSNTYINYWINRYARIVCENTKCLEGSGNVTTVIGTASYSIPASIFEQGISLVKRSGTNELTPIDVQRLASIDTSQKGTPIYYLPWAQLIWFYPIPSSVETITVWGNCYPTHLSGDSSILTGVPRELVEVIMKLVVAKCYDVDQDYGVANNFRMQVPMDVSDYIFKTANSQQQMPAGVRDVMNYGGGYDK